MIGFMSSLAVCVQPSLLLLIQRSLIYKEKKNSAEEREKDEWMAMVKA
jgi:hypothetical protein